jgi:hypothetical protein
MLFNIKYTGFSTRKNFVGLYVLTVDTVSEYDLLDCNTGEFGEPDISEEHIISIFRVKE